MPNNITAVSSSPCRATISATSTSKLSNQMSIIRSIFLSRFVVWSILVLCWRAALLWPVHGSMSDR